MAAKIGEDDEEEVEARRLKHGGEVRAAEETAAAAAAVGEMNAESKEISEGLGVLDRKEGEEGEEEAEEELEEEEEETEARRLKQLYGDYDSEEEGIRAALEDHDRRMGGRTRKAEEKKKLREEE